MKAIYRNLKDQILTKDKSLMKCFVCGGEYSASKGDYWFINDNNYEFLCCNEVMSLVYKETVYRNI